MIYLQDSDGEKSDQDLVVDDVGGEVTQSKVTPHFILTYIQS